MSSEMIVDLVLWVFFFLGQCMWILKCAAAAIRSKNSPVNTRFGFIAANWDIFVIRMSIELIPFWILRHVSIDSILGWFGSTAPKWIPMGIGESWLLFFLAGLGADIAIDSLAQSNWIPEKWRKRLKEEIPEIPHPIIEVNTKTTIEGETAKTETTTEVKKD